MCLVLMWLLEGAVICQGDEAGLQWIVNDLFEFAVCLNVVFSY